MNENCYQNRCLCRNLSAKLNSYNLINFKKIILILKTSDPLNLNTLNRLITKYKTKKYKREGKKTS